MPAAKVQKLVLDTSALFNPGISRAYGEHFYTIQAAIDEIKDVQRREIFERERGLFGNGEGIHVQEPSKAAIDKVTLFARYTGDFAALSKTDIKVLALAVDLELQQNNHDNLREKPGAPLPPKKQKQQDQNQKQKEKQIETEDQKEPEEDKQEDNDNDNENNEEASDNESGSDSDSDGDWITPENIHLSGVGGGNKNINSYKGKSNNNNSKFKQHQQPDSTFLQEPVDAACFTGDFAMQNVGLQMNLTVLGVDGRSINRVKTWVLRCHSCFKVVKPSSSPTYIPPKFCPSCGNTTLLRTSVTYVPISPQHPQGMIIHLKKNFQYKNRGKVYSIPAPKYGKAKQSTTETNELILREDQKEWSRAASRAQRKLNKEEERRARSKETPGAADADWVPDMLLSDKQRKKINNANNGAAPKLTSSEIISDLPTIGHGRRNPNENRRHR